MKKSVVLSFVTLSSFVLMGLAQADELVPVSPELSLVTAQPEAVSPTVDVPPAVDSSQPVEGITEVVPTDTVPAVVDVTTPVPEVSPETSPVVATDTSSDSPVPQVTPSSDMTLLPDTTAKPSVGVETTVKEEIKTEVKTDNQVVAGVGQAGAVSQVTGQVIQVASPQVPVTTDKGQVIVGTQDSQLVVETSSGERQVLAPEQVGARTNADGTISVKTSSGQMVTLPKTGERGASVLSVIGGLVLAVTGFRLRRPYRHF